MEYKIVGDDMQAVQIELKRGEEIYAEAGAMLYMGPGSTCRRACRAASSRA